MTEYEGRDLVWQKIAGSEKLYEIYEYYPTLHDAHALKIDCSFEKREICMTFYYSDMVGEDVDTIAATLITLCWENVVEADFSYDANYLYGVELKFINNLFETIFEESYFAGRILCEDIKVLEIIIEPDTSNWTSATFNMTKFSYR